MDRAQRLTPEDEWQSLSVLLTGHTEIQALNREFLAHDDVTDVISFRLDPVPGEPPLLTGELIVNVELAFEEGTRRMQAHAGRHWSPAWELALYLAHGCDHLTGATDSDAPERRRMRRRELSWLRQANERELISGIWDT
jgi:rRNA maturation RNase YbeY